MVEAATDSITRVRRRRNSTCNVVLCCCCYYFVWRMQTQFEIGCVIAAIQNATIFYVQQRREEQEQSLNHTIPNHNIFLRKPYINNNVNINIQQQNPTSTISVTDSFEIVSSSGNSSSGNILLNAENRKSNNKGNGKEKKTKRNPKVKKCKTQKDGKMSMNNNTTNNNDIPSCPPVETISSSPSTTTFFPTPAVTTTYTPTILSSTFIPTTSSTTISSTIFPTTTTGNGKGKTTKTKSPSSSTITGKGMSKNSNGGKKSKRPSISPIEAPSCSNPVVEVVTQQPTVGTITPTITSVPPSLAAFSESPVITIAPMTVGTVTPTIASIPPSIYSTEFSTSSKFPSFGTATPTVSESTTTTSPPVIPDHQRQYDITLNFDSASVPDSDRIDFITAAQRWERIITGDIEDIQTIALGDASPEVPGCSFPTDFIDDLYLCIYYQQLTNGIIGTGGFSYVRPSSQFPITGFVRIDPDAIADARAVGYFNALLLHEMGHAIGVGTSDTCPTNDINSNANREYHQISQCTTATIPMDTAASGCSHYSEDCLRNEIMTPMVDPSSNPLSRITIGWCEDIGYEVDYTQADPYTNAELGTITGCNCNRRSRDLDKVHNNNNKKSSDHQSALNNTNVRYLGQLSDLGHPNTTSRLVQQQQQKQQQSSSSFPSFRKLSNEAYNIAFAYGLQYLKEQYTKRQNQKSSVRSSENNDRSNDIHPLSSNSVRYVGDKMVWVYIREGDSVHSVLVQR